MNLVQSRIGVAFQSSAATTKVASPAPRNSAQNVTLCQLPGSGVGQMRNGGASSVRSRKRSRMSPAVSPQADTTNVMVRGQDQIPFAVMRQVADGFATAK